MELLRNVTLTVILVIAFLIAVMVIATGVVVGIPIIILFTIAIIFYYAVSEYFNTTKPINCHQCYYSEHYDKYNRIPEVDYDDDEFDYCSAKNIQIINFTPKECKQYRSKHES